MEDGAAYSQLAKGPMSNWISFIFISYKNMLKIKAVFQWLLET